MAISYQIGVTSPTDRSPQSLDFYPFAYALFDENLGKHCWYCLDDEKKHKRCMGCHRAMFCDQNCQMLAWKDHKFECRGIRANDGNVPDIEVRILGRIVTRHKAIACGMDKKDPNFYRDRQSRRNIMDIWAHTKSIEKDTFAMGKFDKIFGRLSRFYEPKALLPKDIVFELHCRDFINRHAISDKHYLREIGKGLYLDLCAYDHSCRPNTVYSCRSFVATLRPLHANVKMVDRSATFYSYIDLLCAKQDRCKLLKDTWYFHCKCERCEDDSENILTAMLCPHCPRNNAACLCPFGTSDHKDAQSQLLTCPKCGTMLTREEVMEAIGAMRFINEVLEKTDFERMDRPKVLSLLEGMMARFRHVLPPENVYFCKIVQALLPHIDQTDNARLLALHLLVEPCIRQCYPHNHPALAFHLRNIGIFSKEQNDMQMAKKYLTEAFKMFEFVMGAQHSLTTLTGEILGEILKEGKEKETNGETGDKEEKKEEETMEKEGAKENEGERKKGQRKEEEDKQRKKENKKSEEPKEEKGSEEKEKEEDRAEKRVKGKEERGKVEKSIGPSNKEEGREKVQNGGGSEWEGTRIILKIEPPAEEEEEQGRNGRKQTADEELVTSLVRISINSATQNKVPMPTEEGEKKGMPTEDGEQNKVPMPTEEGEKNKVPTEEGEKNKVPTEEGEKNKVPMPTKEGEKKGMPTEDGEQRIETFAVPSPSRPGSSQSGAALSPHYSSSDGGGAKKKLKMKKCTRRKRTPLPPKPTDGKEEEEEKSEESTMEEIRQEGEGTDRKSREEEHRMKGGRE